MNWFEITVLTSSEASDAICERMTLLGAHGTSVQDPREIRAVINAPGSLSYADEGYLDSLGDITIVRAYFADTGRQDFSEDRLIREVSDAVIEVGSFLDTAPGEVAVRIVRDEDWANSWKKYFKPLRISPRVIICPSWEECTDLNDSDLIVKLDPGSAFGTGEHATTAMCAFMLDQELGSRKDRTTVLDLGCGSGILAIIAAGLGAAAVDAIDIDPVAAEAARSNCFKNSVCDIVNVMTGELSDIKVKKYDIIIANIISDVIVSIISDIPAKLENGGIFIAGGIISEKKEYVLASAGAAGLELDGESEKDGWAAMRFWISV